MSSNITITGNEQLQKQLNKLLSNGNLEQTLNKACIVVENDAKRYCPVDSGELRGSITHQVKNNEGYVGTNVEYAPYVEFGTGLFAVEGNGRTDVPWFYQDAKGQWHSTVGQQPQPFLHPALSNNRERIVDIVREALLEGVSNGWL